MQTFKTLINGTLRNYKNATNLSQLVPMFIKRAIEDCEGIEIPKGQLIASVQEFVNSYGENMIQNQLDNSDNIEYTICGIDEVASHISNMGWIVINDKSINNTEQYHLILNWFVGKGIKDYEYLPVQ